MRTAFAILIIVAVLVGLSAYLEPAPHRLSSEAAFTDAMSAADAAIKEIEIISRGAGGGHTHTYGDTIPTSSLEHTVGGVITGCRSKYGELAPPGRGWLYLDDSCISEGLYPALASLLERGDCAEGQRKLSRPNFGTGGMICPGGGATWMIYAGE